MKRFLSIIVLLVSFHYVMAQDFDGFDNGFDDNNTFNPNARRDTTKTSHKKIPRGMFVWTIDQRFGDRTKVARDTVQHLFMNTGFTKGMYGEYNTTGNVGSPRINRIFTDRMPYSQQLFSQPYDYFITPVSELRFTNTLSPITNVSFYSCGDKTDGEDHLKAMFAVNASKELGFGFKFNYVYGRGYYQNQSTSLFDYTLWGSYLGDRYQAHAIFSIDHMKNTENGGITDDNFITHPESFNENFTPAEIPVNLSSNWNRYHNVSIFFNHRYSIGFNRKVPMTEEEKEAHRFALASKKESEKLKQKQLNEEDGQALKGRPANTPIASGRPEGAVIKGDLPNDSTKLIANERIEVPDKAVADSLIAASTTVQEDTSWLKDEYVPVTSFIHTLDFKNHERNYIAYASPKDYYAERYKAYGNVASDSIDDLTRHFSLRNTLAIALLEGFNKYVKTGLKVFASHEIRHFELPDTVSLTKSYNENNIILGAQLSKREGNYFHYTATAELGAVGEDFGDMKIDADADVNVPMFGDTLRVDLRGFIHRENPVFLMRHFHSKHIWWDNNDMDKQMHTHLEGTVNMPKTKTRLRVAYDNLEKYAYLSERYELSSSNLPVNHQLTVRQSAKNISVFTAQLSQDFVFKPFVWENRITYQKSSVQDVIPVPDLNVWSNLYLDFRIARVLKCHFGAQVNYFTEYEAPNYFAPFGQYAVQENPTVRTKVGNYPFVDVYANFVLKGCRFFIMMSHVNAGQGTKNYFTVPHYPQNDRVLHLGISWNFYN